MFGVDGRVVGDRVSGFFGLCCLMACWVVVWTLFQQDLAVILVCSSAIPSRIIVVMPLVLYMLITYVTSFSLMKVI